MSSTGLQLLSRRWSTIDFFLKKKSFSLFIVFKIKSFQYSKKNLWRVLFIVKLQPENIRNIFICDEKANYIKDYMKARR